MTNQIENNYFIALRRISNMLRNEFNLGNSDKLALLLCDRDIYELTPNMKEILLYIQENVIDFNTDVSSMAYILEKSSLETLKEKKVLYEYYIPESKAKKKPDLRCFMIDKGKISEYERVFERNGFSADEIHQIVANLINIVAKNPDDVLKTLNELKMFDVSDKDYRNFVLENTFYLFRAFSKNLNVCFSELIEKCRDKEKAFEELCKHPEIMTEYEDL